MTALDDSPRTGASRTTAATALPPTPLPHDATCDRADTARATVNPNRAQRRRAAAALREQERCADRGLLGELEFRNRRQLLPHYGATALLGLAASLHEAALQTQSLGTVAWLAAASSAGTSAAALVMAQRRHLIPDDWQLWRAALTTAAAVWTFLAVTSGVTWSGFAVLLAAEYALGARWWQHVRQPNPTHAPATAPVLDLVVDDTLITTYVRRWADNIGCTGGALAGSALTSHTPFEHGIEYVLRLVGGKQDITTVLAVLTKIASGLNHPAARLIAEPFVDDQGEERPALVKFTVITAAAIQGDVFFRGPRIKNGYLEIGPYLDGRGAATYQLWRGKRLLNGLLIGGTGSGKSRLLELIGLGAMSTGKIHVIHADGMNGASCPTLWQHTEHYGRGDADLLLNRLTAMQAHREHLLREQKLSGLRPSSAFPGVLIILDEAHRMITEQNWPRWCNLAREINKLGMGILAADQDAKLTTWRDGTMRASLQAGNGIGLRVKDRAAGQILDTGGFNLFDLPKTPGIGFVMESDDADARQAPFRGLWLPDLDDAFPEDDDGNRTAERQIPAGVTLIEDWYASITQVELDDGTRAAKDAVDVRTVVPTSSSVAAATNRPGATIPRQKLVFPTGSTAGLGTTTDDEPNRPPDRGLTKPQQQVLAAIQAGNQQPSTIAAAVGKTPQAVAPRLRELVENGHLSKTGAGPTVRYELRSRTPPHDEQTSAGEPAEAHTTLA